MANIISEKDLKELERAKKILENPSLAMKIADKVGQPIEYLIKQLPGDAQEIIVKAIDKALWGTLNFAVETLDPAAKHKAPSNALHKVSTFLTGTIAGLAGLASLPIELPATTTLMFRSICEIARSKGFDVTDPAVKLDCMQVFALGGYSSEDDAVESGYYATRIALAAAYREAARYLASKIANREAIDESAPVLIKFIMQIASRFQVEVTAEAAAKVLPFVSGLLGGSVNVLFTDHFQKMAEGHFTVRSLEEKYGEDVVREMWGELGR